MNSRVTTARPSLWGLGRKSISLQLSVLVLVALLPAFLATIWHLAQDRERDRRMAREHVSQLAANVASRLQARLDDYTKTLTLIAAQPTVRAMRAGECDPLIGSVVGLNPAFVTIGTRDREGHPVCSFVSDAATAEQMLQFPWFQPALESAGFSISDAFMAPKVVRWVSVLTMPIRDDAGAVSGIVALPLDLAALSEQVMKDVPDGVLVTVLDRRSQVVLRSHGLVGHLGRQMEQQRETLLAAVRTQPVGMIELNDVAKVARAKSANEALNK